ncbi:MAG: hypothetical protein OEV62_06855, partial [Actinomycetota bacterium]|nr:hypothetical protein [Actinomycetota bacterium]
ACDALESTHRTGSDPDPQRRDARRSHFPGPHLPGGGPMHTLRRLLGGLPPLSTEVEGSS